MGNSYITERQRELAELRERHDRYLRYIGRETRIGAPIPPKQDVWSQSAWTADVGALSDVDPLDAELIVRRRADELAKGKLDEFTKWAMTDAVHRALNRVSGDQWRGLAAMAIEPPGPPAIRTTSEDKSATVEKAIMLIHYANTLRDTFPTARESSMSPQKVLSRTNDG